MSRLIIPDFTLHPASSVDLHMHTTYSDGRWPATQLIEYLASNGFDLVAVTDHDRVNKVAEIQELGAAHGLAVLSGVEMSTEWRGPVGQNRMADLLCFGFDPLQNELAPLAEQIDRQRIANAYEINEYLRHKGYDFPRQDELLADHNGKLDRPGDNIRLLREHGYISDYREGFKLIVEAGYHAIRYDIAEVVEATHRSGGVSLIAHPGRNEPEFTFYDIPLLDQIRAEVPLDGIEVIHPTHSKEMTERYLAYVQQHNLLSTTGSDSHCSPTRMPIRHRAEISQRFFERLGIRIV
ncbi:PHP-like protein [Ktedonobacteria bacterium brp13]|nr:PHP-like protein [Ktedonobacteria bacterium brp13]